MQKTQFTISPQTFTFIFSLNWQLQSLSVTFNLSQLSLQLQVRSVSFLYIIFLKFAFFSPEFTKALVQLLIISQINYCNVLLAALPFYLFKSDTTTKATHHWKCFHHHFHFPAGIPKEDLEDPQEQKGSMTQKDHLSLGRSALVRLLVNTVNVSRIYNYFSDAVNF